MSIFQSPYISITLCSLAKPDHVESHVHIAHQVNRPYTKSTGPRLAAYCHELEAPMAVVSRFVLFHGWCMRVAGRWLPFGRGCRFQICAVLPVADGGAHAVLLLYLNAAPLRNAGVVVRLSCSSRGGGG